MIALIKEFLAWRKALISHSIDLTPEMKRTLAAFDYNIALALQEKTLDKLAKEMVGQDLSPEYVRGAKFALAFFTKHFKPTIKK